MDIVLFLSSVMMIIYFLTQLVPDWVTGSSGQWALLFPTMGFLNVSETMVSCWQLFLKEFRKYKSFQYIFFGT